MTITAERVEDRYDRVIVEYAADGSNQRRSTGSQDFVESVSDFNSSSETNRKSAYQLQGIETVDLGDVDGTIAFRGNGTAENQFDEDSTGTTTDDSRGINGDQNVRSMTTVNSQVDAFGDSRSTYFTEILNTRESGDRTIVTKTDSNETADFQIEISNGIFVANGYVEERTDSSTDVTTNLTGHEGGESTLIFGSETIVEENANVLIDENRRFSVGTGTY